jgi:two-component sensor histidine kinase
LVSQRGAELSEAVVEDVVMVLDELATNALRHGSPPARVELCRHGEGWLVIAHDAAPGDPPVTAVDRPPEFGGMGLRMVTGVTVCRGTDSDAHHKSVWALVAC